MTLAGQLNPEGSQPNTLQPFQGRCSMAALLSGGIVADGFLNHSANSFDPFGMCSWRLTESRPYLEITARELFTYTPDEHTIVADGDLQRERALLIAIANSRQYGNGAIVAPAARVDDGKLDVVVIAHRSPLRALVQVPRIFQGRMAEVPGVTFRQATDVEITSARQVLFHVDGEPFVGGASIRARVRPRAATPPGRPRAPGRATAPPPSRARH